MRPLYLSLLLLALSTVFSAKAARLYVPNHSFELPATGFADPRIESWVQSAKPVWFQDSEAGTWDQLAGVFVNQSPENSSYIHNMEGNQAAFFFAMPELALSNDINFLTDSTNANDLPLPAKFTPGKAFELTVGILGGGGGMTQGVSLQLSFYYRDANSNAITFAATNVVFDTNRFPDTTNFVDVVLRSPVVREGDAAAGKLIGVQILSTVDPTLTGGYWDLDNVRLREVIELANGSFEQPETAFVDLAIAEWQKPPRPFWYPENSEFAWEQLSGVFVNADPTNSSHITNIDGKQAAYLFAVSEAGFFQDYYSLGGTNSEPSHAFNTRFEEGMSYQLSFGILGGGGGMTNPASLQVSLYSVDSDTNRVTVVATNIVFTPEKFPTTTAFVNFDLTLRGVNSGDAWIGKYIGVKVLSTVSPEMSGGYWDLDNFRLTSRREPLLKLVRGTNQLDLQLTSEPGEKFEIIATADLALPVAQWTSLGMITNRTGRVQLTDVQSSSDQTRFYMARRTP
ncbi:MAG: hypothetical protein SFY81_12490 [Verrucomicrobiota bacterium]|nr:hypothetical protein [Verrucomicrobiota bacterium]